MEQARNRSLEKTFILLNSKHCSQIRMWTRAIGDLFLLSPRRLWQGRRVGPLQPSAYHHDLNITSEMQRDLARAQNRDPQKEVHYLHLVHRVVDLAGLLLIPIGLLLHATAWVLDRARDFCAKQLLEGPQRSPVWRAWSRAKYNERTQVNRDLRYREMMRWWEHCQLYGLEWEGAKEIARHPQDFLELGGVFHGTHICWPLKLYECACSGSGAFSGTEALATA